jgi:hypothetical protein
LFLLEFPDTEECTETLGLLVGFGELLRLGRFDSVLVNELKGFSEGMRLRPGDVELEREREPSS